jgi:ABC-2 type transport system permease protein
LIRLALHYLRFNLSAGMNYTASFIIQVAGMLLNNGAFVIFWLVLFERVGGAIGSYEFADVMFLWSLTAFGFGISAVVAGNSTQLSRIIYSGELDVYLLQPKPVLANLLLSRSSVSGWGDLLYGVVLYLVTQPLSLSGVALFLLFGVLLSAVLTAMRVIFHSLTFFLGNSETLAATASDLMITFVLYPGDVFTGVARALLHSLIPAAIVGYIPRDLVLSFDPLTFLIVVAADIGFVLLAILVFHVGLRKYESGNRVGTRL